MKMASRLIDLIRKKTDCTCSTLFLLISKKQICEAPRVDLRYNVIICYLRNFNFISL